MCFMWIGAMWVSLFSHVVADGVWQDDHAALALFKLFGHVHRRSHGCPGAASCYSKKTKCFILTIKRI